MIRIPTDIPFGSLALDNTIVSAGNLELEQVGAGGCEYWYRLESDGTDSLGTQDLTAVGTPSHPTGYFGNGYQPATSNYYYLLDSANLLTFYKKILFDFWLKPSVNSSAYSSDKRLMSFKSSASGQVLYDMIWSNTNQVRFYVNDQPNLLGQVYATVSWTSGTWTHFQFIFDFDLLTQSNRCTVYQDGSLCSGSYTNPVISPSPTGVNGISFGILGSSNSQVFPGVFDNIRIWERTAALSTSERNTENPNAYASSGTATIIIGLEGMHRIKKIIETSVKPSGTDVGLYTRTSDVKPSAGENIFTDSDGYQHKYFEEWDDTVPSAQVEQLSDTIVRAAVNAKKYVELEIALSGDGSTTPQVSAVNAETEIHALDNAVNRYGVYID